MRRLTDSTTFLLMCAMLIFGGTFCATMYVVGALWERSIQPAPVPAQPGIWVLPDAGDDVEPTPNYDNDCREGWCGEEPV